VGDHEDSVCVTRILNGDNSAFQSIVNRHQKRLYAFLYMMIQDRSAAEEIAQDAFMRAYAKLAKYQIDRPFYPWLATIAARLAINWITRVGAKRIRESSGLDLSMLPSENPGPAENLAAQQKGSKLWDHVAQLPQGERTAVILFYKQEMTVTEIADILGVTKGTIKTLLHRGRAHLRTYIETKSKTS
jgi:RNA polymerase sigma-70 factor (ECF subfamily)